MKQSDKWFIVSQVWLAAGVAGQDNWFAAFCVVLGSFWFAGSLWIDVKERERGL